MINKTTLIFGIFFVSFISCNKCQDCTHSYELIGNITIQELDAIANIAGFNSYDDFYNSLDSINALNKEYCDNELSEKQDYSLEEDLDQNGTNDIRYYFNCK